MLYDDDPRVAPHEADVSDEGRQAHVSGFAVTTDAGERYLILDAGALGWGWTICHPEPPHQFVMVEGAGFAIGIVSADAAIGVLIGPPKTAAGK